MNKAPGKPKAAHSLSVLKGSVVIYISLQILVWFFSRSVLISTYSRKPSLFRTIPDGSGLSSIGTAVTKSVVVLIERLIEGLNINSL